MPAAALPIMGVFKAPLHAALAIGYLAIWTMLAIDPVYRTDWALENILVVATVILLVFVYRRVALTDRSWLLIWVFMIFHTIGSHYTYAETPIGFWMQDLLSLERNHYDRVIHFSFGLMLFWPLRELVAGRHAARGIWADVLCVSFMVSLSALYELIEWAAAIVVAPDAAIAFLGTQGDVFDAQKDSGLALIGALISFALARLLLPHEVPGRVEPPHEVPDA